MACRDGPYCLFQDSRPDSVCIDSAWVIPGCVRVSTTGVQRLRFPRKTSVISGVGTAEWGQRKNTTLAGVESNGPPHFVRVGPNTVAVAG
eukprot:jgi/Chrzof1/4601/Cz14g19230.t1